MNAMQLYMLQSRETDVDGAIHRLCDSEEIYNTCLRDFLCDGAMDELNRTVGAERWDEAFTAAHALKGVAGNLGFVPLMHAAEQLVVAIRGGRMHEVGRLMEAVNHSYRDITDGIRRYFRFAKHT